MDEDDSSSSNDVPTRIVVEAEIHHEPIYVTRKELHKMMFCKPLNASEAKRPKRPDLISIDENSILQSIPASISRYAPAAHSSINTANVVTYEETINQVASISFQPIRRPEPPKRKLKRKPKKPLPRKPGKFMMDYLREFVKKHPSDKKKEKRVPKSRTDALVDALIECDKIEKTLRDFLEGMDDEIND